MIRSTGLRGGSGRASCHGDRSVAGLVRLLGPHTVADEFVASASVASEPPVCPHGAVSSEIGRASCRERVL